MMFLFLSLSHSLAIWGQGKVEYWKMFELNKYNICIFADFPVVSQDIATKFEINYRVRRSTAHK